MTVASCLQTSLQKFVTENLLAKAKLHPKRNDTAINSKHQHLYLVVDRVLGPVLAQGLTATGSLTRSVKPERLARRNWNDNWYYNC